MGIKDWTYKVKDWKKRHKAKKCFAKKKRLRNLMFIVQHSRFDDEIQKEMNVNLTKKKQTEKTVYSFYLIFL